MLEKNTFLRLKNKPYMLVFISFWDTLRRHEIVFTHQTVPSWWFLRIASWPSLSFRNHILTWLSSKTGHRATWAEQETASCPHVSLLFVGLGGGRGLSPEDPSWSPSVSHWSERTHVAVGLEAEIKESPSCVRTKLGVCQLRRREMALNRQQAALAPRTSCKEKSFL